MRYFKVTENGYITAVGMGFCGDAIDKEEYDAIVDKITNVPQKNNAEYRLKDDLTWEEIEIPDLDAEEMLNIVIGGAL